MEAEVKHTPENEYIAQVETSKQVTEDHWRIIRPAMKIDDSTTIGEIRKWMADELRLSSIDEFTVIKLAKSKGI